MRKVIHEVDGRKYIVLLPEGADNPDLGIPYGPPPFVDDLELPEPFATRLHNQMFNRSLFSLNDLRQRPREVQAALQAVFRMDAATILDAYAKAEKETLPFE